MIAKKQGNYEVDSLLQEFLGSSPSSPEITSIKNENDSVYQLPVRTGKLGKSFGEGDKPWVVGTFLPNQYVNETHPEGHMGIDLKATKGTPIYPIGPGKVIDTSDTPKGGHTCKVSHEDGLVISYYAHMNSVNVHTGQEVDLNTVLGTMGDSGNAAGTGAHLHYEVKINGSNVNPANLTGKKVGSLTKKAENINAIFALLNEDDENSKERIIIQSQETKINNSFAQIIDQFLNKTGSKLPINGQEIMNVLNCASGAQIGLVVKALKEKLSKEPKINKEQILEFIKLVPSV